MWFGMVQTSETLFLRLLILPFGTFIKGPSVWKEYIFQLERTNWKKKPKFRRQFIQFDKIKFLFTEGIDIKIQILMLKETISLNQGFVPFFNNIIPKKQEINMLKNVKQLHEVLPKHSRVYEAFSHRMPHYAYPQTEVQKIQYTHSEPKTLKDKIAYQAIKFVRKSYDYLTRYDPANMTETHWIKRCMFLETVAGVPGMVGGMCRHLRSLRTMKRDNGWIHHLIEQADNQRFHLIIFLNLRKPSLLERAMVISIQGVFMNSFFLAYLLNPKFCHRFVGYLQEQAVKTYTMMLRQIQDKDGVLHHWNKIPAPKDVIEYYHLDKNATFKDVIMSIRADEACHRQTNHFFAEIDPDYNIVEQKTIVYNESSVEKKSQNVNKI